MLTARQSLIVALLELYSMATNSCSQQDAALTEYSPQITPGRRKYPSQEDRYDVIRRDGTALNRDRDAPGQNCAYIAPGKHHHEFYRLATYAKFPKNSPVKQTDLAAAGFYWTGYKDRVKCFSCGMTVENFMLGDDGMDMRWHKSACRMSAGLDDINVPIPEPNFRSLFRLFRDDPSKEVVQSHFLRQTDISEDLRRIQLTELPAISFANIVDREHEILVKSANLRSESDRRKTFDKWPSYPAPYLVSELAKQGFFYLGNLDRTQCFSCSGVLRNWAPTDDVSEQHMQHFGHCKFGRGEYSGNIPMPNSERAHLDELHREKMLRLTTTHGEPPDPSEEEQHRLAERFPCRNPMNPHMKSLESRTATFDRRWPKERIRAPVDKMAKAGLFFLGESDKTKCFYCNGGLQNWDRDDEPWTEHAKWFPGCEFVLRMKGMEFVQRLRDAHPNLNRPAIRNPVSLDVPPNEMRRAPRNASAAANASSQVISRAQIENMGFSAEQIERAISRRGHSGYSMNNILQDLLEGHDEMATPSTQQRSGLFEQPIPMNAGSKREGTPENGTLLKKTRLSTPLEVTSGIPAADGPVTADSLRQMEAAVLCKQCKMNRSEITLIPCGHLCLCEGCATNATRCIICKGRIAEKIKVYRA